MKVIIIEDEKLSAEHLTNLLEKTGREIQVLEVFDSVKKSIDAFRNGLKADLLFVDIHLGDGLSFEIFSEINVETPIIFTTAYDEFAIRAFKLNSVDYLLKPIGYDELTAALAKYDKFARPDYSKLLDNIVNSYHAIQKQYKTRFMIKSGDTIASVKAADVSHFIFEDGLVLVTTNNNNRYPLDFSLEQLESILDPAEFFRINRKVILNINAIQKSGSYFNSRLKVTSPFLPDEHCVVSRERVLDFKTWLGG
jgi:DNA-binding LytR/AlgR family response regulator